MVGTPTRRHRRTAAIRARRAIAAVSPIRERDRRAEQRRLQRARRDRARAALLRGMREVLGLPLQHRRRRLPPQRVDPRAPIVLSSDDELPLYQPPPQHPVVDLNSSVESLPNIDPRPQFQLPVQPLPELGPLNITFEFPPPLQHQSLREAYVLLRSLQLPPFQPITPPPELYQPVPTPPLEPEEWEALEAGVAEFDFDPFLLPPPPISLQQPVVQPIPQHVPNQLQQPKVMPDIDWAAIAHALLTIAEQQRNIRNPN